MRKATIASCCAFALSAYAAMAGDGVSTADLQAAVHSFGFVDSLQKKTAIDVGVVYEAGSHDGKAQAVRIAATLSAMRGPVSAALHAEIVSVEELARDASHFDVLYLASGPSGGGQIAGAVKRQHALSISDDPACLDAGDCVLMVRAGASVDVVLDTALAAAAGIKFSSIFAIMVKRR